MIAIEQYRAAIGYFHPKCVVSNHPKYNNEFAGVNDLLKFMVISLMNWIRGSLVTGCWSVLVTCIYCVAMFVYMLIPLE